MNLCSLPQNISTTESITIKLQKHEDGRSRGRAFVQFPTKEAAAHIFDVRKTLELWSSFVLIVFFDTNLIDFMS